LFLIVFYLAGIIGLVYVYLGSFLFKITGKLFHGKATYKELRAVIVWAGVPVLYSLPIWIIMFAVMGFDLFRCL
jgi:hypothetical protein